MADSDYIDVKDIAPAEIAELSRDKRREKIYTRRIEGFFQRLRLFTGWPLLLGYFCLPWITLDGRQAVLFDLPARQFHILGLTLWPQDFPLLAFLLIIAAFGLFAVTVFAGRVWCGYTCPQTVWTSIFMWVEQKCEGTRNQRIRRDEGPWTLEKGWRKSAKHVLWMMVALITGLTFVGYFYPVRELLWELLTLSTGKWQFLWTLFFTLATYINAGWMREQVCTYMCPYARFQSVMFDSDTLIVSYDPGRGEPRGSRRRDLDPRMEGLGDCIDCELCVQVCPTGIDIRNGLQYECIGCALCIDACNSVMHKMQYDPGLIRYTSERQLNGGRTHWLRPRIVAYAAVLLLMLSVLTAYVAIRTPLEMTVSRDRNALFLEVPGGNVENVYSVHLLNMDAAAHVFTLRIEGLSGVQIIGEKRFHIPARMDRDVTLRLRAPATSLAAPSNRIDFILEAEDSPALSVSAESRFLGPT